MVQPPEVRKVARRITQINRLFKPQGRNGEAGVAGAERSIGSSAGHEKSHTSNSLKNYASTANFNPAGAPEGEKNPSIVPAITRMG
jgi:hypothetical protein